MADELQHDKDYYYTNVPWRHSGLRATFFGMDPWVLLTIPLSFITLAREWPGWFIYIYVAFFMLAIYVRVRKFASIGLWLSSLRTRAQGVQWPTR